MGPNFTVRGVGGVQLLMLSVHEAKSPNNPAAMPEFATGTNHATVEH
jgi:hypothetical protein